MKTTLPGRYVLDGIAFMPHAIPGILFGIVASLAALFVLQKVMPIYGSVALIGIVYTIGWLSFGTRIINSSLIQIQHRSRRGRPNVGRRHGRRRA